MGIQQKHIELSTDWKLRDFSIGEGVREKVYSPKYDKTNFIPAVVPGTVRQALLKSERIPDPYYGYNNEKSLWVEEKEWWFCKDFEVDDSLKGKFIQLIFEGTVFKGEVWLNGEQIGELEGMFNPRSFDVSDRLNFGGKNHLSVRLEAPEDARNIEKRNGLTFDNDRDQLYSIAQCLFGWDWAPHTVPIGIWKPVKLDITGEVQILHPQVTSKIQSSTSALLNISCEIKNLTTFAQSVILSGTISGKNFTIQDANFRKKINLKGSETQIVQFQIQIKNPKLWWLNGIGEQNLYLLKLQANIGDNLSDRTETQFGIREIRIVENENIQEFINTMKDQAGNVYHLGKAVGAYPWTFVINGKKIFAKGANWIPIDQLLRLDRNRYDHLLKLAKEAHFNLLRVWGGGLYETDDFYELCDEYGILVWQEFLSNKNFSKINKTNFLEGADAFIRRIRNHPSLALYCGGNEFDPDDEGSKSIIDALEELISRLDSEKEFHRASPYKGDDHYWGVWHGKEPYTRYRVVRPFRSEAGINTFPVAENYNKFTPQELQWTPDKIFIEYHGENRGKYVHLEKLIRYAEEFGESSSIEEFIQKSQLYQALANAFNMDFCRSRKFRNSGLLYWQYNDTWPCISWALVDWYGTPKPGYYFVKQASNPVHIAFDFEKYLWSVGENFSADVYVLNDQFEPVESANFSVMLMETNGTIWFEHQGSDRADANSSRKIYQIQKQIPSSYKGKTLFLIARLFDHDQTLISENIYPIAISENESFDENSEQVYFNIFKDMNSLPQVSLQGEVIKPEIRLTENRGEATLKLTNPSDSLAFFIRIRLDNEDEKLTAFYSNNYFSLLPGETKEINCSIILKTKIDRQINFQISGWNCSLQKIPIRILP